MERAFDDYGARWLDAHVDACRATRFTGDQSEALLDLRTICLDDRRREWKALIDVLAAADRDVVRGRPKPRWPCRASIAAPTLAR